MDVPFLKEETAKDTTMDEQFDYNAWLKCRKQTTRLFYLESAALGMEYALTFVTLYVYLKDVLFTKDVVLFYSAISATYAVSQICFSLIFSRLFDKYRNLKTMFLIGNSLIILGNFLYTVPLSPWLLFTGRLISGAGGSLRAIMTSELTRSYPEDELMSMFSVIGMSFGIGFILGPAINFCFVGADFWILGVHINYANASGLVLTLLFIIVEILAIFFVSDLSSEYDLKQENHKEDSDMKELLFPVKDGKELKENPANMLPTISKLLCNINICSILLISLFLMHCFTCFDIWQPMATIQLMNWSILEINVITSGQGLSAVLMLLMIAYRPPSNNSIVYLAMVCVVGLAIILGIYLTLTLYSGNKGLNIFLWSIYCLCFSMTIITEEVFLVGTLAQMVPSNIQAFAESVRQAFSGTGEIIALLAAGPLFGYLTYVAMGYIGVTCIILVTLIWRKSHYQKPTIQEL